MYPQVKKVGINKNGNVYTVYDNGQYSYDNDDGSYYSHFKMPYGSSYINNYYKPNDNYNYNY